MHIIGFLFDIFVLLNRLNQFSRFLQYPHMTFICYLMGIEDGYFTSRHDESFFFLQRIDITKVDLKSKSINVLRSNLKFPKEGKKITKKKKLIFGISI